MLSLVKLIFYSSLAVATTPTSETYTASARDKSDRLLYQEHHEVVFNADGKVHQAKTEYVNADGKIVGELVSNFDKQITAPEHTFKDLRDGSSYGLEIKDEKFILWRQEKNKAREEKSFSPNEFTKNSLVVGCQGLHYYLIDHLEDVKTRKEIPIKYLIPGKLDYYSFTLKFISEDEDFIYLGLKIDSVFLRLFTDEINLKYRKKDRHLAAYSGLSNIPDENGKIQFVNIDYDYSHVEKK